LRFYTWKPDTLSLGYFQRLSEVPGHAAAKALVRRITGGGAIHHVDELTFSISAAANHPLYAGPIAGSYRRVHDALCEALASFGVEASLRGSRAVASDREGTGMCFHHSTALDIVWGDKKGVGSAQRRTKGRVLHHGSIKLGTSALEGDIATLRGKAAQIDVHVLAEAVKASFGRAFGVGFEAGVPDERERAAARALGKRYISREFLEAR
jgi:lipoate-protein ligase A